MFNYIDISYLDKIMQLLSYHKSSSKLADYLEVSRGSIVNWKDDDSKINDDNKLKIDVAYCEAFGFSAISADVINDIYDELQKTDFSYFNSTEEALVQNISRSSAFGSLEIEETHISQKKFNKIVRDKELVKDLDQREFLSINNLAALSDKVINDTLRGNIEEISCKDIKNWHFMLMSGIRSDAGEYSTKYRIIPGSEELTLTDPRDVPEELERWTNKYQSMQTLKDIAEAHAHFELIHPFGDGNGRIGRILMSIHSIDAGFIPPLIDKSNKALYYVVLKHAQVTGEHSYLSYFIAQSILSMHKKFFRL
jgi:Fic family protein